jgi:hypothetical protein
MIKFAIGCLFVVLLVACLVPAGCASAEGPHISTLTKQQWHEDVRYLARELPLHHKNAFHSVSRDEFERAMNELDGKVDSSADYEIFVGMMRICALVGDAHTAIGEPPNLHRYPLAFYWFGKELRVILCTEPYKRALGAKVVKVGDKSIEDAAASIDTLIAHENDYWVRCLETALLRSAELLHALKVTPKLEHANWTFEDDGGKRFTLDVPALAASEKIEWVSSLQQPPLYRQRPNEPIWFTSLAESQSVYVNLRGNPDDGTYRRVAAELMKTLDDLQPKRLVIDVRLNRGGDFNKARNFLLPGLKQRLTRRTLGSVYVITGRATQSAAVINAIDFRRELHATLVGEPTGGRPNGYSENANFRLPNSKLQVSCSCRYYRFQEQDTAAVMPDELIEPDWRSYAEGRDLVMEWVLKQRGGS